MCSNNSTSNQILVSFTYPDFLFLYPITKLFERIFYFRFRDASLEAQVFARANKGNTVVLNESTDVAKTIEFTTQEGQYDIPNKDPMGKFQKVIKQITKNSKNLPNTAEKCKYIINNKIPPQIYSLIKLHKEITRSDQQCHVSPASKTTKFLIDITKDYCNFKAKQNVKNSQSSREDSRYILTSKIPNLCHLI